MTATAEPPPAVRDEDPAVFADAPQKSPATVIIGAGSPLAQSLAARLEREPSVSRLLGLDFCFSGASTGKLAAREMQLLRADLARVIDAERARCLVFLLDLPRGLGHRAAQRINMGVAARVAEAIDRPEQPLERVVLLSSTEVYAAAASAPCFATAEPRPPGSAATSRGACLREIERMLGEPAQRRGIAFTVLRAAPIAGSVLPHPMEALLRAKVVPVPIGFDARVQWADRASVVDALALAATGGLRGIVHSVVGETVPLRRLIRLVGGLPVGVPEPLLSAGIALQARRGSRPGAVTPRLLRHWPVADAKGGVVGGALSAVVEALRSYESRALAEAQERVRLETLVRRALL